ncbi:MAG: hypothetical protein JO053_11455 [Acidobacteria bacterium]|nr:hypothetical protein [Acidobacteriota bacterium]
MMKVVRNILITAAMVAGLSIAAFAQKDGDKKPPPKNPPPVINPSGPKPPPPKDTKPKKPGGDEAVSFWREDEVTAS